MKQRYGESLDRLEIQTESFRFIVTETHTTATTMTFLIYHLLDEGRVMEKLVKGLDASDPGTRRSSMEGMAKNTHILNRI